MFTLLTESSLQYFILAVWIIAQYWLNLDTLRIWMFLLGFLLYLDILKPIDLARSASLDILQGEEKLWLMYTIPVSPLSDRRPMASDQWQVTSD